MTNRIKYQDVQYQILSKIEAGIYRPNQKLPSDYELANTFQCSRLTIRKAIDGLIQQQKIVKYPGKGNYVMGTTKIQSGANGLQSFTERAQQEQKIAKAEILQLEERAFVPDKIKPFFAHNAESSMIHVVRLRSLDDEPMTLENIYLPSIYVAEDRKAFALSGSLYAEIEKTIPIGYAHQEIEAIKCPATIAALLAIEVDDPVLLLRAMTYAPDGTPIMYETSYYRGDKYSFKQINSRQK